MEGTATISLDTLDELRKKAEEAETEKKRSDWFVKKLMNCYGFDTEAYDKALKEIDNKKGPDRQAVLKAGQRSNGEAPEDSD